MNGNGKIAETGTVAEAKNGLSLYLPAEEAYRAFTRINTAELREYSSGESHFAVDDFFSPAWKCLKTSLPLKRLG